VTEHGGSESVAGRDESDQEQVLTSVSEGVRQMLAQTLVTREDGDIDLMASMGGVRGLLESVVPITVFSLVWGFTSDLWVSVIAAVTPSVVLAIWRLVARQTLMQAVGGLFGIALGAVVAVWTGHSQNFFLPSILKNLGYGTVYAVSALVGWPVLGLVLGLLLGEGTSWRAVRERRRVYQQVTWLWAAMFGLRLAIQVPLWAMSRTAVLGAVNVVLGLPLFGVTIWLSWVLLRGVPIVKALREAAGIDPAGTEAPDDERTETDAAQAAGDGTAAGATGGGAGTEHATAGSTPTATGT